MSCKTIEYVYPDYTLPEAPQSYSYDVQELQQIISDLNLENQKLLQNILLNYISNIQEWKVWENSVKAIIDNSDDTK